MHRNNRINFTKNYKHINIHKYNNCLKYDNINKINNWIRHFLKKHNIKYNNVELFPMFKVYVKNEYYIICDGAIYIDTKQYNNKWIKRLKLICEKNEIILCFNKDYFNKFLNLYNKRNNVFINTNFFDIYKEFYI